MQWLIVNTHVEWLKLFLSIYNYQLLMGDIWCMSMGLQVTDAISLKIKDMQHNHKSEQTD